MREPSYREQTEHSSDTGPMGHLGKNKTSKPGGVAENMVRVKVLIGSKVASKCSVIQTGSDRVSGHFEANFDPIPILIPVHGAATYPDFLLPPVVRRRRVSVSEGVGA